VGPDDRINNQGLPDSTHAALPHLLEAAEDGPRQVADIVNISSIAGRVAWSGYGVYNMTKWCGVARVVSGAGTEANSLQRTVRILSAPRAMITA
jgi:NADP-dependent 3-hydroxy acid dehydrogenase YdfG